MNNMGMFERLKEILKSEDISSKELDLHGAKEYVKHNETLPECQFQLELKYDMQNRFSSIFLNLTYRNSHTGEVTSGSGFTVYQTPISTQTK